MMLTRFPPREIVADEFDMMRLHLGASHDVIEREKWTDEECMVYAKALNKARQDLYLLRCKMSHERNRGEKR